MTGFLAVARREIVERRLEPTQFIVERGDLPLLDGLEKEMSQHRLAGGGDVGASAHIAPGINQVAVPHHAATPADEIPKGIQFGGA